MKLIYTYPRCLAPIGRSGPHPCEESTHTHEAAACSTNIDYPTRNTSKSEWNNMSGIRAVDGEWRVRVCELEDEKVGLDLAMFGARHLRGGLCLNKYKG